MTADPLAVAALISYCGWNPTITAGNQSEVLDGNGGGLLALPCLNVTAVVELVVTDADGTIYTLDPANDIEVSRNGLVGLKTPNSVNLGCFTIGLGNIAVTFTGGLTDPTDVANVAAAVASIGGRTNSGGLSKAEIGSAKLQYGTTVQSGDLLDIEKMVLDRYRLPKVSQVR